MFKLIIFSGLFVFCAGNYGNISLINFDHPCLLENGENGEYATLINCPTNLKELKLGAKFQKICEIDEICWDVVCCNGKTKYGSEYDVTKRLERGSKACKVQPTGVEGTYVLKKYCPSLVNESINKDPICPFTFCENYVCCPQNTTEVLEKSTEIDYFNETCLFDEVFDYNLAYEELSSCIINIDSKGNKKYGRCRPYFKCDEYANSYDWENDKFSVNVTLCGYNCCVPMVCCGTSYLDSFYGLVKYKHLPLTKARSACLKANPKISNYDIKDSKHIDNRRSMNCKDNSSIVESKNQLYLKEIGRIYSVVFGYVSPESSELIWDCEGVMLTKDTVLTTASCLESLSGPVVVRLGEEKYEVNKIIKHPQYNPQLSYHDIGLLITKKKFKLEANYNFACLPETRNVVNEERLFAGNADSTNKSAMKIVGTKHCSSTKDDRLKYGLIEDIQFCADLIDASLGNCPLKMVGSPLVTQSGVVVGLNQFGRKCEDQTGSLFESTYPYVRWIETYFILSK